MAKRNPGAVIMEPGRREGNFNLSGQNEQYEVIHYEENGRDIYQDWIDSLRDAQGKAIILRRVNRLREGSFGSHRFCRDGVWELVVDTGPGYRVYYSKVGNTVLLLLCAGSKRTQDRDIDRAVAYLKNYKEARHEDIHHQS